ncbi:MAG UNVERIFIED_CONTAM: hypothetical protein LVR29_15280 [Microcystis novacekii LVE1205-3]
MVKGKDNNRYIIDYTDFRQNNGILVGSLIPEGLKAVEDALFLPYPVEHLGQLGRNRPSSIEFDYQPL